MRGAKILLVFFFFFIANFSLFFVHLLKSFQIFTTLNRNSLIN